MKTITFGGNPVTLVNEQVNEGDKAPDFNAIDNSLKPVKLSDFKGKVKLISVFPSIDTSVCSVQNHKFNDAASSYGDKVAFIAISNDLPFALKRFCGAEGINNLVTLSDHRDVEFGTNYGFLIKELRLLARGVVIIDKDDVVRYVEYVPEITQEPNYDAALNALKELV
ncbi:thiol peroxidase [Tenuifilum thalassicum]|uniref:Thiol peroxidase n=1 Tax=Tenuifilum thalassicum TaxID=2590900 RepID=A0A7D4BDQ6_9BACT|nr:thiol peroxidase [Tenuifilum thalassicum]QKG79983.1 thiol peroxidase [Tenuifilum thalassicum]